MTENEQVKKIEIWFEQAKKEREPYESVWREIAEFICPWRARHLYGENASDEGDGRRKDTRIINAVATDALKTLASGMQSGLTSKARPWFDMKDANPALNRKSRVLKWYFETQQAEYAAIARTNAYDTFLGVYMDLGAFGTAAFATLEHPDRTFYTVPFPIGSFWATRDPYGGIDAFFHVEYKTVRQMVTEFGKEKCSEFVRREYESTRFNERVKCYNAIFTAPESKWIKAPGNKKVISVWWEPGLPDYDKKFLKVSGFRSMPVVVPRWETGNNDAYGHSPCMDIIGTVRALQRMESDVLGGIAKQAAPPMVASPEIKRLGLNTSPNGVNYVSDPNNKPSQLYAVQLDLNGLLLKVQKFEQVIREGLYNNLFMAIQYANVGKSMTAREVQERSDEKYLMLGPVLEKIQYEMLAPFLNRVTEMMMDAGHLPEPPPELYEGGLPNVDFISILSQAQKSVGVVRIEQMLQFIGGAATLYPEIKNALNPGEAARIYGESIGVQAGVIRDVEEFDAINAQQNQMQALAQQAAIGKDMAAGAETLSKADPANLKATMGMLTGGGLA